MPSSRNRRLGTTKAKPPVMRLHPPAGGAQADAALVVRYVRFMDETFGPGVWEFREGEPEENNVLRYGMFIAFQRGAGAD